jgi:hypothetical protein
MEKDKQWMLLLTLSIGLSLLRLPDVFLAERDHSTIVPDPWKTMLNAWIHRCRTGTGGIAADRSGRIARIQALS